MTVGRILGNDTDLGSGFALATPHSGPTRVALTAYHVVRGKEASSLQFVTQAGLRFPVKHVEPDEDLDVAVLLLGEDVPEGLAVGRPVEGGSWQVETQPRGNDPKLTGTISATHRRLVTQSGHEIYVLQLQVDQILNDYKGYSGSPVALKSPADIVIGVLIEQLRSRLSVPTDQPRPATNILYAIPIQDVLDRFGLTYNLIAQNRYVTAIQQRYQHFMLPVGDVTLNLLDIYQPLQMHRATYLAERQEGDDRLALLDEIRRGDNDERRQTLEDKYHVDYQASLQDSQEQTAASGEEALSKSPSHRLVVLGTPGSGKTTLLQSFIVRRAAAVLADLTLPLPLLLSLPEIARARAWQEEAFHNLLVDYLNELHLDETHASTIMKAFHTGKLFLCLDGLDEVAPNVRGEVIRWINGLPEPSGQGAIVIGSRFTEYKGGELKRGLYYEWVLKSLDDNLRLQLAKELLPQFITDDTTFSPETFLAELKTHPRAASWGNNPLLFTLAAYVYATSMIHHPKLTQPQLPRRRVELYSTIVNAILEYPAHRMETTNAGLLTTHDIFARVALSLFTITGRTFTAREITEELRQQCPRFALSDQGIDEKYQRFLNSGLLEVVAMNTYGFRHLTFQEYLAAVGLVQMLTAKDTQEQNDAWKLIQTKATRSRWSEVLRLCIGLLIQDRRKSHLVKQWFQQLIAPSDGDPGQLRFVLAVRSLAELDEGELQQQLQMQLITQWAQQLFTAVRQRRTQVYDRLFKLIPEFIAFPNILLQSITTQSIAAFQDQDSDVRQAAVQVLSALGEHLSEQGISTLITALQDDRWSTREAAAQALGALGEHLSEQGISTLITALQDDRWSTREAAAQALGALGEHLPEDGVSTLIAALQDKDVYVHEAAALALGALGKRVPQENIKVFIADLINTSASVRKIAAQFLGSLGEHLPEEGLNALIVALGDSDSDVRAATALALGKMNEHIPMKQWISMLTSNDRNIRAVAVKALGQPGQWSSQDIEVKIFISALQDEYYEVGQAAAQALGSLGRRMPEEGIAGLVSALQNGTCHYIVRDAAALALGTLGERVSEKEVMALISALQSALPPYSRSYAVALGMMSEHLSVNQRMAILTGSYEALREIAAYTLSIPGEQISEDGIAVLITALRDQNIRVREAAALALKAVGKRVPEAGMAGLITAFPENDDCFVRQAMLEALGRVGERLSEAGTDMLISALQDSDRAIRPVAAQALGARGQSLSGAGVAALFAALQDTNIHDSVDDGMYRAITQALGSLDEGMVIDELQVIVSDTDENVRRHAIDILKEFGKHLSRTGVEILISTLENDANKYTRARAAEALSMLDGKIPEKGVEALISALNENACTAIMSLSTWFQDDIAKAAAAALGTLGERIPERAVDLLIATLQYKEDDGWWSVSSSMRKAAAQALGPLGNCFLRARVAALLTALQHSDAEVREGAIQGLGAMGSYVPANGVAAIITALQDTNSFVRKAAVRALGTLGDSLPQKGIEALLTTLRDDDSAVREVAAQALGMVGKHVPESGITGLIAALQDRDSDVREAAAQALGMLGSRVPESGITGLIAALQEDRTSMFSALGAQALGKMEKRVPETGVMALIGFLHASYFRRRYDAPIREATVQTLRSIYAPNYFDLEQSAILVLQRQQSISPLLTLAHKQVADVAGDIGKPIPEFLTFLHERLDSTDWEVRIKTIQALGKIRRGIPDETIRKLEGLWHDLHQPSSVHNAVDDALGEILAVDEVEDDT